MTSASTARETAAKRYLHTRIAFGSTGMLEDPRGLKVKLEHDGRTLLGDVIGYDTGKGGMMNTRLTVRHFNGEAWPLQPLACKVEVIRND